MAGINTLGPYTQVRRDADQDQRIMQLEQTTANALQTATELALGAAQGYSDRLDAVEGSTASLSANLVALSASVDAAGVQTIKRLTTLEAYVSDLSGDDITESAPSGTSAFSYRAIPLRLTGPLTHTTDAMAGELVAFIEAVPAGVTPVLSDPATNYYEVTALTEGWCLTLKLSPSVGTMPIEVTASGAVTSTATVAVASPVTMTSQLASYTVTEKDGVAWAGYQLAMLPAGAAFPWKAGMASDFSNLVFRLANGTVLIPWIQPETIVAGVSCTPWVKVPMTAGQIQTIAAGVTTAVLPTSTTRATRVWNFADDLEEGVRPSKWASGGLGDYSAGLTYNRYDSTAVVTGTAISQGMAADSVNIFGGVDAGSGVNGLIHRYTRAGVYVDSFSGVPHNNGLSLRANGNVLSCSAGNTTVGPKQSIVSEFTRSGVLVQIWDFGTSLFFGGKPNGSFKREIADGFEYIVIQTGTTNDISRRVAQVIRCMNDGTWSLDPLWYELDCSRYAFNARSQNVFYRVDPVLGEVIYSLVDNLGTTNKYGQPASGTAYRWKLDASGVGVYLPPWRSITGAEREAITHDGTDFLVATHAGGITKYVFAPDRSALLSGGANAGYKSFLMAKQARFAGASRVLSRGHLNAYGGQIGLSDDLLSPNNGVAFYLRATGTTASTTQIATQKISAGTVTAGVYTSANQTNVSTFELRRRSTGVSFLRDGATLGTDNVGLPAINTPLAPRIGFATGSVNVSNSYGLVSCDYIAIGELATTEPTVVAA